MENCRMVARSIISEIGHWGDQCTIFGGLSPALLVPNPTYPLLPHIGTRDVDLAIGIATLDDERELYRTLKNNLHALQMVQRDSRSFEWYRTMGRFEVKVELFVPVDRRDQGA